MLINAQINNVKMELPVLHFNSKSFQLHFSPKVMANNIKADYPYMYIWKAIDDSDPVYPVEKVVLIQSKVERVYLTNPKTNRLNAKKFKLIKDSNQVSVALESKIMLAQMLNVDIDSKIVMEIASEEMIEIGENENLIIHELQLYTMPLVTKANVTQEEGFNTREDIPVLIEQHNN